MQATPSPSTANEHPNGKKTVASSPLRVKFLHSVMDEFCLKKMSSMLSDLDHLIEGTNPRVQSIPNMTVHVMLQKIRKDLKQMDTRLFMNSRFLEGLIED